MNSAISNLKSQISNFRSASLFLSFCALTLSLSACQADDIAPSPGMGDPYIAPLNDPQISILSPELRPWLGFHPAVMMNVGNKPLSVERPVRNLTYNQYLIEYRFLFYDENNRELEPVMGWKFQSFDPKQIVRLKGSALSTEAKSYRLELRWSK